MFRSYAGHESRKWLNYVPFVVTVNQRVIGSHWLLGGAIFMAAENSQSPHVE